MSARPRRCQFKARAVPLIADANGTFKLLHQDVAAIDIGSEEHVVSVPEDRDTEHIRTFGCTTPQLAEMADWLSRCGIRRVVMEATGVYFVPVFEFLQDRGFATALVDGREVRNVPGKTDAGDSHWIRTVYSYGLVRECFLPDKEQAVIRTYWRQRGEHVAGCAQAILHMHKALEQMNVQLHKVLSDVSGVAGMAVIHAIASGERDPETLAAQVKTRVRRTPAEFVAALTGHYRDEHVFALSQAVEAHQFFQRQMQACDVRIASVLAQVAPKGPDVPNGGEPTAQGATTAMPKTSPQQRRKNQPYFELKAELIRITGVDATTLPGIDVLTAQTIYSECGYDLASFANEACFSSWLGLCPNNRKTGGKVRRTHTKKVSSRAATAFRVAAQSLHRSRSAIGAFARRMRGNLGPAKGITATAHKLAILFFRLVRYGHKYVEIGAEQYEEQYRQRQHKMLERQARKLGYHLVQTETGVLVS